MTIAPDPENPEYESREKINAASDEFYFWSEQLSVWQRFLRWRTARFERRAAESVETGQPAQLPEPSDVDAYALHLELRTHLLETVALPKESVPGIWHISRNRLDTLEPQLAELRLERGLPVTDNPPPPALEALWADEAAKKAAELAAFPIIQPAFCKLSPDEEPRDESPVACRPRPPQKRKRNGEEERSDPSSVTKRTRRIREREESVEPPAAVLPAKRQASGRQGVGTKAARDTEEGRNALEPPVEAPLTKRRASRREPRKQVTATKRTRGADEADQAAELPVAAPPAKRRATKQAARRELGPTAEAAPRRSTRLAGIPRKNYKA